VHYRLDRGRSARQGLLAVVAAFGLTVLGLLVFTRDANPATGAVFVTTASTTSEPALTPIESATTVAPATTLPPTTPPTTAAPTTVPPTTIPPTTVAPTTTIWATATLPEQPPEPIIAPADPHSPEPVIALGGITIPKIGVNEPLYEGIRLTTLDYGPGHWPGTAMPGDVGNAVIAAHRTSHGATFRNIDQLVPGDEVQFTTSNGISTYHVTSTEVVTPDAVWIVDPTPTATATLFACHPPGSVSHRIVVKLELAN
jgi:sortase A